MASRQQVQKYISKIYNLFKYFLDWSKDLSQVVSMSDVRPAGAVLRLQVTPEEPKKAHQEQLTKIFLFWPFGIIFITNFKVLAWFREKHLNVNSNNNSGTFWQLKR